MAKKKSAPKSKPDSAMYPKHEPLTIQVRDSAEVNAAKLAAYKERRLAQNDFEGRLEAYTTMLREIVLPHYGERPTVAVWGRRGFTETQWANIDLREGRMFELPASAPEEARHAFEALRKIKEIRTWMRDMDKQPDTVRPDTVRLLFCWAIDVGLSLQRCDAQTKYGPSVATGMANARSRDNANVKKSEEAHTRREMAKAEYNKRKTATLSKTSVLRSMGNATHREANSSGLVVDVRTFGSYSQLVRGSKDW